MISEDIFLKIRRGQTTCRVVLHKIYRGNMRKSLDKIENVAKIYNVSAIIIALQLRIHNWREVRLDVKRSS